MEKQPIIRKEEPMGNRPAHIEKARLEGDTDLLSAAGRKGARVRAQNREANQLMEDRIIEQRANDELRRARQAGEHIIPLTEYD